MPKILVFGQYVLFFWTAEDGEPVHIHASVRSASELSAKFWLTSDGGCILANNRAHIPMKDIRSLSRVISLNHGYICEQWCRRFGKDNVRFYC